MSGNHRDADVACCGRGERITRAAAGFLVADVDAVAAEGYEACMQGEVIRVPGLLNQAATIAGRAVPKWLLRRIAGSIGRSTLDD
ncbi:MAG: hypothetical protein V5B60_15810 [Accumulibacter sp.]|uniref:hypothetical protein n=1 Tax=Accumulibacter sp. TaxID=2053492 RepID=UPI002FC32BB6